MLVSVRERTREIGVRRAVGATRNTILMQFLVEAVVIASLGGLIGLGAGRGHHRAGAARGARSSRCSSRPGSSSPRWGSPAPLESSPASCPRAARPGSIPSRRSGTSEAQATAARHCGWSSAGMRSPRLARRFGWLRRASIVKTSSKRCCGGGVLRLEPGLRRRRGRTGVSPAPLRAGAPLEHDLPHQRRQRVGDPKRILHGDAIAELVQDGTKHRIGLVRRPQQRGIVLRSTSHSWSC